MFQDSISHAIAHPPLHRYRPARESRVRSTTPPLNWPIWLRYGFSALAIVVLTIGLVCSLPLFPLGHYDIPYILTIMAVAYLFGEGPATLAFALGTVCFICLFVSERFTSWPLSTAPGDSVRMIDLVFGVTVTSFTIFYMRRHRRKTARLMDELHASSLQVAGILESITDGFIALDRRWKYTYVNREAERLLQRAGHELMGRNIWGTQPNAIYSRFYLACHRAMEDGQAANAEWFNPIRKAWYEYHIYPSEHGLSIYFRDITEHKQTEEHKRDFYRRTILAATEGKLEITERETIMERAGDQIATWKIVSGEDMGPIRRGMQACSELAGMDDLRIHQFILCGGEATTNALKHANGGVASLHRLEDSLMLVVSDCGPGIDALNLPEVALTKGYSTAGTLGMGYKAMIALADRVYLATAKGGTTLAVEMSLHERNDEDCCTVGSAQPEESKMPGFSSVIV